MDYSGKIIKKTPVVPSQQSASGVWSLDEAMQATKSNTWPVANVPNPISRSLRFRSSASAYLNRTPSTASNRKTWTWSAWVKLGTIDASNGTLFSAGTGSGETSRFYFRYVSSIFQTGYGSENTDQTVAVFRDPSAWYHVVLAVDTTQATANNRIKIYVNGVQQTIAAGTRFTQNTDTAVNNTVTHSIARDHIIPGGYFDGYMTEINLIDGQQLTPSSFGGTNAVTGVWEPRQYTGTYGTNGFYLNFKDNTSTSTLGLDYSGNNNTWTTNNISLTAGSTYDSMLDVPTQWVAYGTGSNEVRGNYCTINPLAASSIFDIISVSQANLYVGLRNAIILSTMGSRATGKYYWEITADANELAIGVATPQMNLNGSYPRYVGYDAFSWSYAISNGLCYHNGSSVLSTGVTATTGDVIGFALDLDNQKLFVSKNGTFLNSGNPVSGSGAIFTNISNTDFVLPAISDGGGTVAKYSYHNYGQRPFAYTPPAGFLSLCTTNLPSPTILQGNQYFDALTWTGNGSNPRSFTGLNFAPDFVWAKNRSVAYTHSLYDVLRGAGANKELISASTSAEGGGNQDEFGYLSSFDSAGFTSAAGSSGQNYYFNDVTYPAFVAWNWKANGAGVSNTAGSITSTVSANTTAGFSVVTFSTNASSGGATIGHGLGAVPSMIIMKARNQTYSWDVYHASLGASYRLILNSFSGQQGPSSDYWNSTTPTSSVFSINQSFYGTGVNTVAYCFSEIAGYSKMGLYTGNGSSDGPFVYCGFRPKFIIWKNAGASANGWVLTDTSRSPTNAAFQTLRPDTADAEDSNTVNSVDFLSNGFKIRGTSANINQSGQPITFMAFAENPFKNALAR